jgi:phage terminase large subunit-like protein
LTSSPGSIWVRRRLRKDAKFKEEYFKSYREDSEEFIKIRNKLENVVICDPAKTVGKDSADTAIVGIGLDVKTPRVYIRDIVAGKLLPDQLYDEVFKMADRINAKAIGIKMTSLNEFIMYPLRTEMIKRRLMFDLVELPERSDKDMRINCMVPFYRMGYVYHNENCCAQLELQLLAHPRSKKKDIMDAEASIIEMLEIGERFFVPKDGPDDDIEDEYKDLTDDYEEEDKPMENWRAA